MCNLNIIIRKDSEFEKDNLIPFLQSVTAHSYASNSDGEGFYSEGRVFKDCWKINYSNFEDLLLSSKIIITHQRLVASGPSPKYNQPFTSKEFVLVHNGVMEDFIKGDASDTWGFFKKFLLEFEKSNMKDREKRIINAVKTILESAEGFCSYSIAILDKTTNYMYYFKNQLVKIHFYLNDKMLYITTDNSNSNLLELLDDPDFEKIDIEDNTIYRIDTELSILPVGEINAEDSFYSGWTWTC